MTMAATPVALASLGHQRGRAAARSESKPSRHDEYETAQRAEAGKERAEAAYRAMGCKIQQYEFASSCVLPTEL